MQTRPRRRSSAKPTVSKSLSAHTCWGRSRPGQRQGNVNAPGCGKTWGVDSPRKWVGSGGARPTQRPQNLGFKSFTFLNAPTQAANEDGEGPYDRARDPAQELPHRPPIVRSGFGGVPGKLQPERSDFSAYGFAIGTGEDRVLTMVELVRAGRSAEELAKEFEPTAKSIRDWVAQADGMEAAVRTA